MVGKKVRPQTRGIILSSITDFEFFFTGRYLAKFTVKWVIKKSHHALHMLPHYFIIIIIIINRFVWHQKVVTSEPLLNH